MIQCEKHNNKQIKNIRSGERSAKIRDIEMIFIKPGQNFNQPVMAWCALWKEHSQMRLRDLNKSPPPPIGCSCLRIAGLSNEHIKT